MELNKRLHSQLKWLFRHTEMFAFKFLVVVAAHLQTILHPSKDQQLASGAPSVRKAKMHAWVTELGGIKGESGWERLQGEADGSLWAQTNVKLFGETFFFFFFLP